MSRKVFTLRVLRIFLVLGVGFFFIFELQRCSGGNYLEEDDFDSRRGSSRDRFGDTDLGGSSYDKDEDEDEDEEKGFDNYDSGENPFTQGTSDDSELDTDPDEDADTFDSQTQVVAVKSLTQEGISRKIDFVFVINSSTKNKDNISFDNLDKKLGAFPAYLNQKGIDWRFYFINSEYETNTSRSTYRNGQLIDSLEQNEGIIYSQYLDNSVAQTYQMHLRDLFLGTIGHDINDRSLKYCRFPPYCVQENHNRPLRALNNFIQNSEYILRSEADLVPIIISNLDEKALRIKPEGSRKSVGVVARGSDLAKGFKSKYPDKRMYVVSIIIKPGDENCLNGNQSGSEYGSFLAEASHLTQGLMLSLCPINNVDAFSKPILSFLENKRSQ